MEETRATDLDKLLTQKKKRQKKQPRPDKVSIFEKDKLPVNALSWGLGLQSTCMVKMVLDEVLPRPDVIVFADPQQERQASYETLDLLAPQIEASGIPFRIVTAGDIHEEIITQKRPEMPFFVNASRYETIEGKLNLLLSDTRKKYYKDRKLAEGAQGRLDFGIDESLEAILHRTATEFGKRVQRGEIKSGWMEMDTSQVGRQCTQKYKIRAVMDLLRKEFGVSVKKRAGQWLGITTDEITRMKKSPIKASVLMYPLIDLRYSRDDCEEYLAAAGMPIPVKSACITCPYHSDKSWKELSEEELSEAADFEEELLEMIGSCDLKYLPYFANGAKLHPSMVSIDERPFEKGANNEDGSPCMGAAGCFL